MISGDVPIDGLYTVLEEVGISFGKWRATKKPIIRGQR